MYGYPAISTSLIFRPYYNDSYSIDSRSTTILRRDRTFISTIYLSKLQLQHNRHGWIYPFGTYIVNSIYRVQVEVENCNHIVETELENGICIVPLINLISSCNDTVVTITSLSIL